MTRQERFRNLYPWTSLLTSVENLETGLLHRGIQIRTSLTAPLVVRSGYVPPGYYSLEIILIGDRDRAGIKDLLAFTEETLDKNARKVDASLSGWSQPTLSKQQRFNFGINIELNIITRANQYSWIKK